MTSANTRSSHIGPATVPVHLALPDAYEPMARYAIRELLEPLGLEPGFETEPGGRGPGIWYGPVDKKVPTGWLHIVVKAETAAFFSREKPLDVSDLDWADGADLNEPVLFAGGWDGYGDPVASAFFWLSGWNERTNPTRDRFGRVPYHGSIAERLGLGDRAPVDEHRDRLAVRLAEIGLPVRRRTWQGRDWALCPTHDVDYVKKWRKGLVYRESVEHLVLNRRNESAGDRLSRFGSFLGQWLTRPDPFVAAIERMERELSGRKAGATWFFKAAAHGPHDVPYSLEHPLIRMLLRRLLDAGHEIGLHPAYHTFDHAGRLADERRILAEAAGETPVAVRSHYLRWSEPVTPRNYAAAGFRLDSTLGWSDAVGFRRGTCLPFRPWDHEARRAYDLREFPLAIMESALFNRLALSADEAAERTRALATTCRRHRGALVVLWHTTLWDETDFPGWGDHFLRTLDEAGRDGAAVLPLSAALDSWLEDA